MTSARIDWWVAVAVLVVSLLSAGCSQGTCASRCPTGCCDATGVCLNGGSSKACGKGGITCSACMGGSACMEGVCQPLVEPDGGSACQVTCDGCCVGEQCVALRSQTTLQCGREGAECTICAPGQLCAGGGCRAPNCNASNCGDGCCVGDTCVDAGHQSNESCGRGGQACQMCTVASGCVDGACAEMCRSNSCAGCCEGNTCLPYGQQGATACGVAARMCGACMSGQSCLSGYCSAGCTTAATFDITSRAFSGAGVDFYAYEYGSNGRLLVQVRTPVGAPKQWQLSQSHYQGPQFTPDLPRLYLFRPCTPTSCAGAAVYAGVSGILNISEQTGSIDAGTLRGTASNVRFIPWDSASGLDPARGCFEFGSITIEHTWP